MSNGEPPTPLSDDEVRQTGWLTYLRPTFLSIQFGSCELEFKSEAHHRNHNGTIAGPVLFGLAEAAAAAAIVGPRAQFFSESFLVVTTGEIAFRSPAKRMVIARATIDDDADSRGGPETEEQEVRVTLLDEFDTLVATAVVGVLVRPRRK